jgi:hypothetical protein
MIGRSRPAVNLKPPAPDGAWMLACLAVDPAVRVSVSPADSDRRRA